MTLRETLEARGKRGRPAFIPYITAGDPDLDASFELVRALEAAGADLVELGVPFSDPVADGPVNQRAAERALKSGTTLAGVLALAARLKKAGSKIPLLAFTYFNPVLRMGLETFAAKAAESGIAGALVVDLPPEEAGEWRRVLAAKGLETVFLAAPTTSDDRLRFIGEASTGFVYCVSRLGVTGQSAALAAGLDAEVARVKRLTGRPVALGFGISTPEQAREAGRTADGVVVGSALVAAAEKAGAARAARIQELAATMVAALGGK